MSRNSALIKFGYSHHKEYDDEKAGNKKHSAKNASFAQHRQQSLIVLAQPLRLFGT